MRTGTSPPPSVPAHSDLRLKTGRFSQSSFRRMGTTACPPGDISNVLGKFLVKDCSCLSNILFEPSGSCSSNEMERYPQLFQLSKMRTGCPETFVMTT